MRELLFCIKHTQNPKTSRLVCYRCEKGWNIYTSACRLHRDTERLEVSSLYPLHPTLTHTGSMRARHSAWGRQSRHQGFNYGCQATPHEPVLRFPRILNHQWEPDLFLGKKHQALHVTAMCATFVAYFFSTTAFLCWRQKVKVCPHSGNRSSEWRG